MSPFLRKVRTASGTMAMQIAVKENGVRRIVEHLGLCPRRGRQKIAAWQGQGLLDLESLEPSPDVPALWVPRGGQALGSAVGGPARGLHLPGAGRGGRGDRAFEQMVLARLIEPSSRDQVPRVLGDLGLDAVSVRTFPWDVVSSGATGRRSLRPCLITSLPPGYWPDACRSDHALLRG